MNTWRHYCKFDRMWLAIENGEPCNWCGEKQTPHPDLLEQAREAHVTYNELIERMRCTAKR